ncbi:hypothetical protein EMPS_09604 [Entomortierella parvispora]|uniref:FAD-binding domain-containing protein n=1 Tax=Entomortierella parvispora TaxID=205924 RepID=A0A9P3M0R4_9FUNG|nr:hypothetical protein EMPS_09604 [Entomortierella parvispora]
MSASGSSQRIAPSVLIIGAGLGGIMLAILLEKMGDVDYFILERSSSPKPLGSAMSLTPSIQVLFEQLGMLEDLQKISLPFLAAKVFDDKLNCTGEIVYEDQAKVIFPRPDLFNLLLSKVPKNRIAWGKRVLKLEEDTENAKDKVLVTCGDNTEFTADVVVGADGVYSSARQNIYKVMSDKGILPKVDKEPLNVGFTCMVGLTGTMDPEKYTELKDDVAHFRSVVGGARHNWGCVNMPQNRFTWQLNLQYLDEKEAKRQQFMNSEWGPESNREMIDQFKDLPNPFGGKMSDFIDATPSELVSKVFLEHKLFKTWHYGRTVLIGDACHKFLPAGGNGAVTAFQDAVILANCLYDLEDKSAKSVKAAFQSYYEQRYPMAEKVYQMSGVLSKVISGRAWHDRLVRWLAMTILPQSIQKRQYVKEVAYRPQVMFLPVVDSPDMVPALPQKPCKRYVRETREKEALEKKNAKAQAVRRDSAVKGGETAVAV